MKIYLYMRIGCHMISNGSENCSGFGGKVNNSGG